jgi:phospholipid transport system substrate-binding protein
MSRNPPSILAIFLALFGLAVWAAAESPRTLVEEGINEVLAVVTQQGLQPEVRRAKLRDLIGKRFDFDTMSRSILARNWKKATPEQQTRFIELFRQLLENTYITTIESYSDEKFHYGKERVSGHKATVPVTITLKTGADAPLVFKLRNKQGAWGVYDVVIEGASLISTYRSSFGTIVSKDGMDGLLQQLEEKVEKNDSQSA